MNEYAGSKRSKTYTLRTMMEMTLEEGHQLPMRIARKVAHVAMVVASPIKIHV